MKKRIAPLLLSLKPCYANLVFQGLKTTELRCRFASDIQNPEVYVYVSRPTMALWGGFRIGNIWKRTPAEIWNIVEDTAKVDKQVFDSYFEGTNTAYALEIKAVWEYQNLVPLNELRDKIPNFNPPQSWRYVKEDELKFFEEIKRHSRTD